ncbi:hypothetical protein QBC37DRAFT_311426 [Rhypophila decipiens]|uniref:Uncharacterized protein n=1 Tax=Rhypophila decipiens TaxID=261697 RepID=A0AAN6YAX2_9PEZI|nr:hypothetical protein QBC37DRAFT_311426 [Rhypophila decipiens]
MFEVDWTDYNSERVGQRRARKEIEKDLKKKDDSRSAHDSVTTRSSSSSGDRHYGILESIGLKKSTASPKAKKPASLALKSIKDDDKRQRNSICAPSSSKVVVPDPGVSSSEEISPKSAPPVSGHFAQNRLQIPWRSTTEGLQHALDFLSPKPLDLAVPAPAQPAQHLGGVAPDSTPLADKVIQSLGSDSFITKTTELVYEPRKDTDTNNAVTGVSIEAQHRSLQSPTPASPPKSPSADTTDMEASLSSLFIDDWYAALHTPKDSPPPVFKHDMFEKPPSSAASSRHARRAVSGTPTRSPRRKVFALIPPSKGSKGSIHSPDSWKPPEAWNCSADKEAQAAQAAQATPPLRRVTESVATASNVSLDLDAMKKEIKKMAVACPQSILVKLNEAYGTTADAGFYKRLEMERKRWMLSALDAIHDQAKSVGGLDEIPAPEEQKVLAAYESQSTTSYLAAFYGEATITHLSISPLSHVLYPNVRPLLTPTINTNLPLAANSFTSIHCLTLPSLVPSPDIPLLLRSFHRCLAPKGILHLNLIDPVPVSKSLGPRMREWLDHNLMFNLAKSFRCTNPGRLLPEWLIEAQLWETGSNTKRIRFHAVSPAAASPSRPGSGSGNSDSAVAMDDETGSHQGGRSPVSPGVGKQIHSGKARNELLTKVGRLLWKEVWGGFVHGNTWWWHDAEIVAECLRMGTYWEYRMIDAVKGEAA